MNLDRLRDAADTSKLNPGRRAGLENGGGIGNDPEHRFEAFL